MTRVCYVPSTPRNSAGNCHPGDVRIFNIVGWHVLTLPRGAMGLRRAGGHSSCIRIAGQGLEGPTYAEPWPTSTRTTSSPRTLSYPIPPLADPAPQAHIPKAAPSPSPRTWRSLTPTAHCARRLCPSRHPRTPQTWIFHNLRPALGTPKCDDKVEEHGAISTNSSVRLGVSSGDTIQWSTEKSPWTMYGTPIPVTFHIPKFLGGSDITATTNFTSQSLIHQPVVNASPQDIWAYAKEGETCYPKARTRTCRVAGNSLLRLIARGLVWFAYDEPTGREGDKHYRWSIDIEKLLPVDERLAWRDAKFSGSLYSSRQDYEGAGCEFKKNGPQA
ncbi:hypothetical protein BD779DRAFT_1718741 [Infundibulicybe gibba]|nr:hypothetical protein BD779DRAFT_1718741 [Infundibulicybe gibba]